MRLLIKKNKELIKMRLRMCTPMFNAALFTTAKRERQLKCLSIDEQINTVRQILISNLFWCHGDMASMFPKEFPHSADSLTS